MMTMTFQFKHVATLAPVAGWSIDMGRFLSPGKSSLLMTHPSKPEFFVGDYNAPNFPIVSRGSMGDWRGELFAGNFVTPDTDDLVGYRPTDGTLWMFRNTPTGFQPKVAAGQVSPASGWQFMVGDFIGKGRNQLLGYHPSNGSLWLGNYGPTGQFSFSQVGTVSPTTGWHFVAGDLTGTAAAEVFGYSSSNRSVWMGKLVAGQLAFTQWHTFPGPGQWQLLSHQRWHKIAPTPPTRAGLVAYHRATGDLYTHDGSALPNFTKRGTVTPADGWQFQCAPLDSNTTLDLAGYHPSNGTVWLGFQLNPPPRPPSKGGKDEEGK